jgi:uncharacterized protein
MVDPAMRLIAVEVAFAERDRQTVVRLDLPSGTTVAAAVAAADLPTRHPGMPDHWVTGIHGRVVETDTVLADGDRVELYRPVPVDPKETRRALAKAGRTMGRGAR